MGSGHLRKFLRRIRSLDGCAAPMFGVRRGEWLPPAPYRRQAAALTSATILRAASPRSFRSEEHTSELQSLMRISYAVFCLKKNIKTYTQHPYHHCTLYHI